MGDTVFICVLSLYCVVMDEVFGVLVHVFSNEQHEISWFHCICNVVFELL